MSINASNLSSLSVFAFKKATSEIGIPLDNNNSNQIVWVTLAC